MNWKSQDVRAGLLFLVVGIYFGAATLMQLELGSLEQMGAGYFPLMLSIILVALGVGVLLQAKPDEFEHAPVNWRALLLIGGAPIAFGLSVRSLGLLPALLISVAMAVLASRRMGRFEGVAIIVGVTVFCVVVFKFGVGIPYPLINPKLYS